MNGKYHLTSNDSSSYANGYDVFLKRTNFREVILEGFLKGISTNLSKTDSLKVIDIGCGNGLMTEKYLNALMSLEKSISSLHLLEPSLSALEEASRKFLKFYAPISRHNITLDDFLNTGNEKDFDLIIASYVFIT